MFSLIWGQNVYGQYTLTGDENWGTMPGGTTPPPSSSNGIIVGSYELKIEGITLTMNHNTSITVGIGGLLKLTDAIIETSNSDIWEGITATGSNVLEQYSTFPTDDLNDEVTWQGVLNNYQTQVILANSFIKYAKIGIKSLTGAIIQTRNSGFYNCEKCVDIGTYSSSSQPKVNACYFMGTSFIWDDILPGFSSSNFIGINLVKVRGVNIGGCEFTNSDPDQYCTLTRGTGINSEESDFAISTDGDELCSDGRTGCSENCFSSAGDGNQSRFEGLTYGIKTLGNTSNKNDRIGIRDCVFEDLLNGVKIEYAKHTIIFESNFDADRNAINNQYVDYLNNNQCEYSSSAIGTFIETNNSSAIRVVENVLNYNSTDWNYFYIQNSGNNAKSLIRKNDIHNSNSGIGGLNNVYGIISNGDNTNLDIECNSFNNLSKDIYIESGSSLKNIEKTGLCNENSWSYAVSSNGRYNLENDGNNIEMVVHNGVYIRIGGFNVSGITLKLNNNGIDCDPIDDCNVLTDETGLGINSINFNHLTIYPNPVYDKLFINISEKTKNKFILIIYDIHGKEILKTTINDHNPLDISNISNGLLLVKVYYDKNTYYQKIFKNTN